MARTPVPDPTLGPAGTFCDDGAIPRPGSSPGRFLHPGDLHVSRRSERITTILGSCVAVCLWHPGERIGGINHFLLPTRDERSGLPPRCYGDVAVDRLLTELRWHGGDDAGLEARIFGGARILGPDGNGIPAHVGRLNAELAHRRLRREGVVVVESDVGGSVGRKIRFDTGTGHVRVRRLSTLNP